MQPKRLLMISTDRKIFEEGSAVRARQIEYAKQWDEVHIVIFDKAKSMSLATNRGHKHVDDSEQWSKVDGRGQGMVENSGGEAVIASNCWAYSTKSWTKFMYPFDAMRVGRFLIEKRGIAQLTCQDASLTAMAGISLKKQFNIPLEIQVHEDIGSPYYARNGMRKIRKSLALSYLPKADRIRVVSNKIKEYLTGSLGIDAAKIVMKPIDVNMEKVKQASVLPGANLHVKYPQFQKIVLMASRLEKEKNIGLAIRAWAEVVKKLSQADSGARLKAGLVIVGDGEEKARLKKLAAGFGLTDEGVPSTTSVIFEDWADQPTLFSYYKSCDQFLVTSLFEGYGMALVEAQAAGASIISTDVGVAREMGAKIVGWDVEEVAGAIGDMLFA